MTTVAYSYVRFSSPEQAKGFSKSRQTEGTLKLCQRHGWKLDTGLSIHDLGKSGFKQGTQVGLLAFIQAIESGQVKAGSVLIVEKLDRLSRLEIDDALDLWRKILRAGVDIATVEPERIYNKSSLNRVIDLMEALIHFSVAHEESLKKHDRAIDNWKRKREAGIQSKSPVHGKIPAWIIQRDGKYFLDPDKAKTIRLIFKMSIEGHGARSIFNHLVRNNIPSPAAGYSSRSKGQWNQRYVEAILADRKVFGEYQPCKMDGLTQIPVGQPIPGYWPAVISEETFFESQAARKLRFKHRGPAGNEISNLFTSIIFDGNGNPMWVAPCSNNDRKAGMIRRISSTANGGYSWWYEEFEEYFLRSVGEINRELTPKNGKENPLPGLQAKLNDVETKLEMLNAELEEGDFAAGVKLLRSLDKQRTELLKLIEAVKIDSHVDDDPVALRFATQELYNAETPNERKAIRMKLRSIIRQMVKRVTVTITNDGNRLRKKLVCKIEFASGIERQFRLTNWKGNLLTWELDRKGQGKFRVEVESDQNRLRLPINWKPGTTLVIPITTQRLKPRL